MDTRWELISTLALFGNKKEANSDSEVDNAVADNQGVNTEDLSNAMAAYTTAISKTKDIKLS